MSGFPTAGGKLILWNGWSEDGEAPPRVTATKREPGGEIQMQRPLCAHPARAVYDGAGDPAHRESFRCSEPM